MRDAITIRRGDAFAPLGERRRVEDRKAAAERGQLRFEEGGGDIADFGGFCRSASSGERGEGFCGFWGVFVIQP